MTSMTTTPHEQGVSGNDEGQAWQQQVSLNDFIAEFGDGLLATLNQSHPPVYNGAMNHSRQAIMDHLTRQPFKAQAEVVHAICTLLVDRQERAGIINAEMGTGKTMMAISAAAVLAHEGYSRSLVIAPPHLVYKWRREILETLPGARVWVLNGPDTLAKLLKLREMIGTPKDGTPEFFIMGRVRMRMGFHWIPVAGRQRIHRNREHDRAVCPDCGVPIRDGDDEPMDYISFKAGTRRQACAHCGGRLWTLMRPGKPTDDVRRQAVLKALQRIPTIGQVSAARLVQEFGEHFLSQILADNVHEFINLMDANGELFFSDRQASRMERAMANIEFGFGEGGYQPTEFIKRFLPSHFFDLLIVDEGHEYKNGGSAQGQAMGVLAAKCRKTILLTGTLMGGYADDLFYLLFRALTSTMIEDGYRPGRRNSLGTAATAFMRDHGILKEVRSMRDEGGYKTARGRKTSVRSIKAPGFGPKGVMRYVLPYTAFLKLKDIGGNVLPEYHEEFLEVPMEEAQAAAYSKLSAQLTEALKQALARRDSTLLGLVMTVLLAWPDCCFRPEVVKHPRTGELLALAKTMADDAIPMPKEQALIDRCKTEKAQNRKVLVYSVYTGKRDTTARLKQLLQREGFKVAVLKASVDTGRREDWIAEQVEKGVDVLITNPELVKTGLDLLDFPTIVFLQTGFNVYTLQQAARRSWRIGQKQAVNVVYLGYAETSQITCLSLMAKKIAVSQSTSGDIPESGLDALNTDDESVEMELARKLVS
ncbi:SNF2-related protein [Carnimonas bestiolae]|uniref:SNF2-related protein n=1 Tax=Carnimonas bestiolae TaxID=3402172 RepID=UPI003EDBD2CA